MAVTETKLHWSGATGKATGLTRVTESYQSQYLVKVSDPLDPPTFVLAHFRQTASLPWLGRRFNFGNGSSAGAICRSIEPKYIPKSEGWYEVTATFESLELKESEDEQEDGETEDGERTDDPLKFKDEIEVGFTQISIPAEFGTFRGLVNAEGGGGVLRPGRFQAVTNSAGVPFDPFPEYEVDIKIIRITKHVKQYSTALFDNFQGVVNTDHVVINKPKYRFVENIPRLQGRLKLSNVFQIINKKKIWRQTVEIYVNPLGWRRQLVDRGNEELLRPGDRDENGNILSAGDFPASRPFELRKFKDRDDYPTVAPILLNGSGRARQPGLPAVFLEWSFYDEKPLAGLRGVAW